MVVKFLTFHVSAIEEKLHVINLQKILNNWYICTISNYEVVNCIDKKDSPYQSY